MKTLKVLRANLVSVIMCIAAVTLFSNDVRAQENENGHLWTMTEYRHDDDLANVPAAE